MKKVIAIIIACLLAVSVCACSTASKPQTLESTTQSDTTTEQGQESVVDSSEEAKEESKTEQTAEELLETLAVEPEESIPEEAKESLIHVVGVFYGDIYKSQSGNAYSEQKLDGYQDLIVVFDFINDATNRTLPQSGLTAKSNYIYTSGITCPEVTLVVNEANTYEAYDPNAYEDHYSNMLNRYTPYRSAVGYGNLFGGSDPVRMYAVFYVNPNEMKTDSTAILTVGDQITEVSFTDLKKITYADEILTLESNYEEAQQIAAFKWRMDKVVDLGAKSSKYLRNMDPGSDLKGFGDSIGNLFSSDYGVTICGMLVAGFDTDHTFDGMNKDLPHFDLNVLTNAFPDQAEEISGIVDATDRLGAMIQSSAYDKDDIMEVLKEFSDYYDVLTDIFGMEIYKP